MKNLSILTLIQALLSLVSGILISKMSFIGKIGVSTFYSQYAVFKTWWKTALILFIVQFVLLLFLQTPLIHFEVFVILQVYHKKYKSLNLQQSSCRNDHNTYLPSPHHINLLIHNHMSFFCLLSIINDSTTNLTILPIMSSYIYYSFLLSFTYITNDKRSRLHIIKIFLISLALHLYNE